MNESFRNSEKGKVRTSSVGLLIDLLVGVALIQIYLHLCCLSLSDGGSCCPALMKSQPFLLYMPSLPPNFHASPDHSTGCCPLGCTNTILDGSPVTFRVSNCVDILASCSPALSSPLLCDTCFCQHLDHFPFSASSLSDGVPQRPALHLLLSLFTFFLGHSTQTQDLKPCTFWYLLN